MPGLKEIAVLSGGGWLPWVAWVLVCTWAPHAHANDPTVLVLEDAGRPAANAFFPALQIQLAGVAEPVRAAAPAADGAGERIERAGDLVRANGALAAVWTERGRAGDPVVLYVVGEREGRALVVVVRVPGARGPDLERTLALKVREFVDEVGRSRARGIDAALVVPKPAPAPENRPVEAPEEPLPLAAASEPGPGVPESAPAPHWGALAVAGAKLGSQPGVGLGRWGLGFGVGPELAWDRARFAVVLSIDVFPETEATRDGDHVFYSELMLAGLLRAELRPGRLAFGAQLGLARAGVYADARTRGNQPGDADPAVLAFVASGDLALPINDTLSAAVNVELQTLADRLTLAVNGTELVDFGYVRARLGISLVFRPFK